MARNDSSRPDPSHDRIRGGELSLYDVYLMQERIERKLDRILTQQKKVLKMAEEFQADLDELTLAVEENTSVDASALAAINGLADQVASLEGQITSVDQAKQAIRDTAAAIRASSASLAAAIPANTPAENGGETGDAQVS